MEVAAEHPSVENEVVGNVQDLFFRVGEAGMSSVVRSGLDLLDKCLKRYVGVVRGFNAGVVAFEVEQGDARIGPVQVVEEVPHQPVPVANIGLLDGFQVDGVDGVEYYFLQRVL